MEAAGLAIGVPGLAALFLQAGLKGYEVLTSARNVSADVDHYIHSIKLEQQRLRDWKDSINHVKLSDDPGSPEWDRHLLIVGTLARIACLFTSMAAMEEEYATTIDPKLAKDQRVPPTSKRSVRRLFRHFRRSGVVVKSSSGIETVQSSSSPASPPFRMEEILPDNMDIKQLQMIKDKVVKSDISIQSIKWVLLDRTKLQELLERLSGYTQRLVDISGPLASASVPQSASEAPAKRQFIVPFPHNPKYVERKDIHDRLNKLLAPGKDAQPRAALWALGGMGKTTIAVEYCYRCWRERPDTSVFWVHASSDEAFQTSYRGIAKRIGIDLKALGRDASESELQDAVKHWLESPGSGEWIMVIDNLDDLDIESKYIPIRQGTILFTTRDSRIISNPRFAVPKNARVEVPKMSFAEASSMCQTLGMADDDLDPTQSSAQVELLDLLENLPLAITQSAAYIQNTGMSIGQYTELFKESADNQVHLLDKPLYRSSKEDSNSRTVMRTWTITIDKIKAENPLALEILQFMSVMNPENIPLEIIRAVPRFREAGGLILSEAIGLLLSFALLTLLESSHYRLHRLVSFWSRTTMQREEKNDILRVATESLQQSFPEDMVAHLPTCTQLLAHSTSLLQYILESDAMQFDGILMLQSSVATAFKIKGEYEKALEWHRQALDGREKTLGKDHPDTLTTVNDMASVFWNQGEYEKALEWHRRALDGREKTLGKDHPDTLTTIHNMASVFNDQGEYEKAMEWFQRVLDGREKMLGKDHPDTLTTVHNMALVFDDQGEYEKALKWNQRALSGREKMLGKDHPDTLNTVHNMASMFDDQGEYEEALKWYRRDLDGCEKALGKSHPSTLTTVNNMASVFSNQGEYEKALEWYQRALDAREKTLGKNHPDTLSTVYNMASVFYNQREYEKALEWYQRALDGREKTLGKDYLDTLTTIHNMASVFDDQGEYEKALGWYQRALDSREKMLGKDHPNTLTTVHDIASVFWKQGEYKKALEWNQRALDGREKALGKNHSDTLNTVHNMASVFVGQGEYEKALEWYQRALDGRKKMLGKDHPSTLTTVHNMASVFKNQGEYEKALEWHQRALDGCEKALGKDHPDTLATVHNMASVFNDQGEYEKALEWYQRALDGYEKRLGKDHPSTLTTVNNMASVFSNQGEYEKALGWYQRALDGRERTLGKDHPSTLITVHNMASVFDDQEEYEKALEWYQRALDGRKKMLGKDHSSTLTTVHNMASVFKNQGEYGKALEWYQRALDGYEKTLGKDHPDTLDTANQMASLLHIRS